MSIDPKVLYYTPTTIVVYNDERFLCVTLCLTRIPYTYASLHFPWNLKYVKIRALIISKELVYKRTATRHLRLRLRNPPPITLDPLTLQRGAESKRGKRSTREIISSELKVLAVVVLSGQSRWKRRTTRVRAAADRQETRWKRVQVRDSK